MSANRLGDAPSITYANAGSAISSGDVVVMGSAGRVTVGVALTDIANGASGEVAIEGEFQLAAVNGAAFEAGETVDWDSSGSAVDDNAMTNASGDVADFAIATETKTAGASDTVKVKLLPGNGTIT